MKRLVKGLLICSGMLAMCAGAFAQDRDRDRDRDHERWDRERMMREYRTAFYDRLQDDLARAETARYLRGDDLRKFDVAHREVGEFSAKWSRGIFDARDLDGAIASVQRVADIPALRREDREHLRDDLGRMRSFRAHMEEGRRY